MANLCEFDMLVAGKKPAVNELIQMLARQGRYQNSGLGRIENFEVDNALTVQCPQNPSLFAVTCIGDCAWSIKTALLECSPINLESECKRLGLVVDVYSSEPGFCFQEHYLCNKGEITTEECVDYHEWLIDGMRDKDVLALAESKGLTLSELKSRVDCNGVYSEGGFGEQYGDFEDLFRYFEPEKFVLDDDFFICDDDAQQCVSGYLWATDSLVKVLKEQEAKHLTPQQLSSMENINFYAEYNVESKTVSVSGDYYLGESSDSHHSFSLPLGEGESIQLISAMEDYCLANNGIGCLESVNQVRLENGLPSITESAAARKPSLNKMCLDAQVRSKVQISDSGIQKSTTPER